MSIDRLPNEVLHAILKFFLLESDLDSRLICTTLAPKQWIFNLPRDFLESRRVARISPLLRVCKRWYSLILRLISPFPVIFNSESALHVARRVEDEPGFGRQVREAWFHAGSVQLWKDITALTPNIRTIYLNLDSFKSWRHVAPDLLGSVNPETMYLHWTHWPVIPWLRAILLECLRKKWNNLRCLYLNNNFVDVGAVLLASRHSPNLRTIAVARQHVEYCNRLISPLPIKIVLHEEA